MFLLKLINQSRSDAMTNLLLMEAILRDQDMNIGDLAKIYSANPTKKARVAVADAKKFKAADYFLTEPAELQTALAEESAKVPGGRAFLFPSQVEDNHLELVVEATTPEGAEALSSAVLSLVDSKDKNL